MEEKVTKCSVSKKCGSCQYQGVPYKEQLAAKQKRMKKLLGKFANVKPIIGMDDPFYYRNKVHAVFDRDKKGNIICGTYEAKTHKVVPIEECMIEDRISQEIIRTIRDMLKSFRIKTYDEDTGYGLLRHVLVRRGFSTDEIMVVLVIGSPIFPSKNNFVKALRNTHRLQQLCLTSMIRRPVWYWGSVISSFMEKDISGIRSADVHSAFLRSLFIR